MKKYIANFNKWKTINEETINWYESDDDLSNISMVAKIIEDIADLNSNIEIDKNTNVLEVELSHEVGAGVADISIDYSNETYNAFADIRYDDVVDYEHNEEGEEIHGTFIAQVSAKDLKTVRDLLEFIDIATNTRFDENDDDTEYYPGIKVSVLQVERD